MNWFHSKRRSEDAVIANEVVSLKLFTLFIGIFVLFSFMSSTASATIFVYEVVTKESKFTTISKLQPDAFLMYNGGQDVIFRLKVLGVHPDKDLKQALRYYGIGENNVRYLPMESDVKPNIQYRHYYWWR